MSAPAAANAVTTPASSAPRDAATPRGVLHYLGLGVSIGLLGVVLVVAAMVIGIPALAKATPYTIVTASMEPSLPPGTLVVVKPTATDDIRIGDVVTYQLKSGRPEVVTHRVIAIQQPSRPGGQVRFITKGDANTLADPAVRPVQVRGTVWYSVPLIGWVNNVVNGDTRAIVIPLLAAGLFVYAGWMVLAHVIGRVRARRGGVRTVEEEPVQEIPSRL